MKQAFAILLALVLATTTACAQTATEAQPSQLQDFPRGTLQIERTGGRDSFSVWVADTSARQEQGLMWVREMPRDQGMVFPLIPPRVMYMWMKNTYLPLDMLFYDYQGRITHIEENTTPMSEHIIESGGVVAGVVELLGGEVARRGIKRGDRVVVKLGGG